MKKIKDAIFVLIIMFPSILMAASTTENIKNYGKIGTVMATLTNEIRNILVIFPSYEALAINFIEDKITNEKLKIEKRKLDTDIQNRLNVVDKQLREIQLPNFVGTERNAVIDRLDKLFRLSLAATKKQLSEVKGSFNQQENIINAALNRDADLLFLTGIANAKVNVLLSRNSLENVKSQQSLIEKNQPLHWLQDCFKNFGEAELVINNAILELNELALENKDDEKAYILKARQFHQEASDEAVIFLKKAEESRTMGRKVITSWQINLAKFQPRNEAEKSMLKVLLEKAPPSFKKSFDVEDQYGKAYADYIDIMANNEFAPTHELLKAINQRLTNLLAQRTNLFSMRAKMLNNL
jgi:hypothetical protein